MTDTPPGHFDWEKEPCTDTYGFRIVGGNVTVMLGYAVFEKGVLLYAHTQIAEQGFKPWRRHWTSRHSAVEAAEMLCSDAYDYITETLNLTPRAVEDLDLEDFLEHLRSRIENAFH